MADYITDNFEPPKDGSEKSIQDILSSFGSKNNKESPKDPTTDADDKEWITPGNYYKTSKGSFVYITNRQGNHLIGVSTEGTFIQAPNESIQRGQTELHTYKSTIAKADLMCATIIDEDSPLFRQFRETLRFNKIDVED